MPPEVVIFDLDGVIVDTARYHFLAWKRLAAGLGIELTEWFNENLKGVGRMESIEKILELGRISLSHDEKMRLADKKNEWFNEYVNRMQPDEVFSGVPGLLHELKQNGIRLALASSSKNARAVLGRLNLAHTFEWVTDGNEIEHSKPHPEIFLKTAEHLNVHPRNCLVIEDAAAGVEAALSAGMKVIGVGIPQVLHRAHRVVAHTGDIRLPLIRSVFQSSSIT